MMTPVMMVVIMTIFRWLQVVVTVIPALVMAAMRRRCGGTKHDFDNDDAQDGIHSAADDDAADSTANAGDGDE